MSEEIAPSSQARIGPEHDVVRLSWTAEQARRGTSRLLDKDMAAFYRDMMPLVVCCYVGRVAEQRSKS